MKFRARRALSLPMLAVIAALCVVLLGAPGAASAKTVGPFYNPHTKSYFALVELGTMSGKSWDRAAQLASTRSYKGVHGRLAVVDDVQTHMWLQEKFKAEMDKDAWIGLRYFCNARKLMWVDGEIMDESPPGVWHPRWHRTHIMCGQVRMTFMGVYYTSASRGMSWQASGQAKHFNAFFVEFPTGGP